MNNKTNIEEDIKVLGETIKGDEDCLRIDLANDNAEDVEHWKREIEAIKAVVNAYYREKARADKLEKEYSKMLTKIDEYETDAKANKYDALVEKMKEKKKWLDEEGYYEFNTLRDSDKCEQILQELIPEEE